MKPELLQAKLCYVDGMWAVFTTQDITKQWGDDWNDAPYEHNAGFPYEWNPLREGSPYEIVRVAFDGPLETPCDNHLNSPYSVQDINRGAVAWLRTDHWVAEEKQAVIPAGTTLADFMECVQKAGGEVYLPTKNTGC